MTNIIIICLITYIILDKIMQIHHNHNICEYQKKIDNLIAIAEALKIDNKNNETQKSSQTLKGLNIDEVNLELMKIEYCNNMGIDYSDYDSLDNNELLIKEYSYFDDYDDVEDNDEDEEYDEEFESNVKFNEEYDYFEDYDDIEDNDEDDIYDYYDEDEFETDEECFYKGLEQGYEAGLSLSSGTIIDEETDKTYEDYKENEAFLEGYEYGFQEGKIDANTYNIFYPPYREGDKYSDYYYDEENKNLENDITWDEILFANPDNIIM